MLTHPEARASAPVPPVLEPVADASASPLRTSPKNLLILTSIEIDSSGVGQGAALDPLEAGPPDLQLFEYVI
jgi:hypothetical protein